MTVLSLTIRRARHCGDGISDGMVAEIEIGTVGKNRRWCAVKVGRPGNLTGRGCDRRDGPGWGESRPPWFIPDEFEGVERPRECMAARQG